ncbi:hypothetical protein V6294_22645 [Serratia marcescens]|uniref:hypothetical protein n=1 Tax=Serratia TaxID=613 RepID=UPI003B894C07
MTQQLPINHTVAIDDPDLLKICKTINPKYKPLSIKMIDNPRPIGNCYWNAWAQAQEKGGKVVYGWLFNEWPQLYITAMHHAVWQSESGELFDVSEKYDTDPIRTRSTFLPDDTVKIDLQRLPMVTSRIIARAKLHPVLDHVVRQLSMAYQMRNSFEQRSADIIYDSGYRCEDQFKKATTKDFEPTKIPFPNKLFQVEWQFSENMKFHYNDAYVSSLHHILNLLSLLR